MLVYIIISLTSTLYCYHAKSSSKKECRVSRSAHSTLIGLYSLTDTGSDIRSIRGLCKNITGPNECMSLEPPVGLERIQLCCREKLLSREMGHFGTEHKVDSRAQLAELEACVYLHSFPCLPPDWHVPPESTLLLTLLLVEGNLMQEKSSMVW